MPYTLSEIERAALHYQQRAQAIKTALQSALLTLEAFPTAGDVEPIESYDLTDVVETVREWVANIHPVRVGDRIEERMRADARETAI